MPKHKETEYISVWISETSKDRRTFRCINCGKVAFEYTGDVRGIILSDNSEEYPKIVQCKGMIEHYDVFGDKAGIRCRTKYVIS